MKIQQIASAYGVTVSAVNKWPKPKRDEAIRNLQAGVNPIIAELVGELQLECYVAQCHIVKEVALILQHDRFFVSVSNAVNGYYIADNAPLNPYELQGAIVKVKELYK